MTMFTPPWDINAPYELVLDSDGGDKITQDGKTWEFRTGKLIKDTNPAPVQQPPAPVTPPEPPVIPVPEEHVPQQDAPAPDAPAQ